MIKTNSYYSLRKLFVNGVKKEWFVSLRVYNYTIKKIIPYLRFVGVYIPNVRRCWCICWYLYVIRVEGVNSSGNS